MNVYAIIIKYLLINIYYNKYYNYIINNNSIKYNNKILYKILLVVKSLKEDYCKEEHSVEDLLALFKASYPVLKKEEEDAVFSLLEAATTVTVEPALADALFESFIKQAKAESIAETAIEVAQGRKKWDELEVLFTPPETPVVNDDIDFISTSIEDTYAQEAASSGIKWRMETLNKILGPLHLGDFGFIFARPEVGKTTFVASEATYLGMQIEQPVLWINNEQRGSAVISRCFSSFFGVTEDEIKKDIRSYNERWMSSLGGRFKFIDNPVVSRRRIDDICKTLKPGLIIIDQLDKVVGFDAERYDLLMKQKYQWARELAKQYGPVIGVSQAGGSAENKRYLDMNDVDSSHTAKQGEADWIIGIGKTNDDGLQRMRYLSVCKNKLPDSEGKLPEMRHAKVEVFINEPIARYEDKIKW